MASENSFKGNIITGLAAGIGATLLAPVLVPLLTRAAKPLTKGAIKGGILLYEKGRESFAELGETVDDLVAEVRSEMETSQASAAVASGTQAANAPGRTAPLSAQPKPGSGTSQNSVTMTPPIQAGEVHKAPSPPVPPTAEAGQGSKDIEGTQNRPPA